MGMSCSTVVPRSDLSQRTTRVTLVPTKHSEKSVFIWDDHFRKYDWGVGDNYYPFPFPTEMNGQRGGVNRLLPRSTMVTSKNFEVRIK